MSQLPADATCSKCSVAATLMCQRCMEYYCTSDCQILDWREHKSKCYQMPQLVPIKKPLRGGYFNDSQQQMRRPHQYSGVGGSGAGGHNDSMRRGSNHSMARNPLPNEDQDAEGFGVVKPVLRPKVEPAPAVVVEEQQLKLETRSIVDGSSVYITRVLTHAEVFIADASCKDYARMFAALAPKCVAYAPEEAQPAKGDFVLVNAATGSSNYFRGEILDSMSGGAYRVLNIDTGVQCDDGIPLKLLRKLSNAMRTQPILLKRVKLVFLESIPHAVPGNKALAALEKCRVNLTEFEVKFDASRPEVVDLLFLNQDAVKEKSLSKKILPLLFEKCESGSLSSCVKKLVLEEAMQPLPPSPPNTPVAVTAPPPPAVNDLVSSAASVTSSRNTAAPPPKPHHFAMPNFGTAIPSDTAAAPQPPPTPTAAAVVGASKVYMLDDLEIVPITVGDDVPIHIIDSSNIFQGFVTASDYGNKPFFRKMASYLPNVSKYGRSQALLDSVKVGGGYAPKPNEICLAVFAEDGDWYRAVCIDPPQKKAEAAAAEEVFQVKFLDYGNFCKVSKREILPITEELMFPANANSCYIEGLTTKEQIMAFMSASTANPIINCKVARRPDGADAYTLLVKDLEKLIAA